MGPELFDTQTIVLPKSMEMFIASGENRQTIAHVDNWPGREEVE